MVAVRFQGHPPGNSRPHKPAKNKRRTLRLGGECVKHSPPIPYVLPFPSAFGADGMFSHSVWWIGIALQCALIIRGSFTGNLSRFHLFYCYIACVLFKDVAVLVAYEFIPSAYAVVYWPMELATVLASFAVIVEVFRGTVRHNPGIVRFVQHFLLAAFAITTMYVFATFSYRDLTSIYRGIEQLGRDLRLVEGALLIALLWLLIRYRISLGRNLVGLIIGYSFWIGINLADFAFLPSPGDETSHFLRVVIPTSYTITLAFWCSVLWHAHAEPAQSSSQLDQDYDLLLGKTRVLIGRTLHSVTKAMKP